jgi:hypothetical protein
VLRLPAETTNYGYSTHNVCLTDIDPSTRTTEITTAHVCLS